MMSVDCPVCKKTCHAINHSRVIFLCENCGHWFSVLEPRINEESLEAIAADIQVKEAVAPLRKITYRHALDRLAKINSLKNSHHLDVGCSIGQFISISSERGMISSGVEPEAAFAAIAKEKGLDIHEGYFPDVIPSGKKYDLISFMDVLGHIPMATKIIGHSIEHLAKDGVVMIKTPSSNGAFFHAGRLLRHIGLSSFWDRLWQVEFASPQIHYFSKRSMQAFAKSVGAEIVVYETFAALRMEGLWHRLLPGKGISYWKAAILYAVLVVVIPVLSVLPKDSMLVILRKKK